MEDQQPSLTALAEELAELRAVLAQQQATIAALQAELRQRQPIPVALAPQMEADSAANADEAPRQTEEAHPLGRETSRRNLLRGAAAATAAAAVATVAVGASKQAHAAPETTGGNFILGQSNLADASTALSNNSNATQSSVLAVSTTVANGYAISAGSANAGAAGTGVYGSAYTGIGVHGYAQSSGTGVLAESFTSGAGLIAKANNGIDIAASGNGRMYQQFQPSVGIPNGAIYQAGEFIRDNIGELWLCIYGDGVTCEWIKVAHLAPGYTSGGAISYLSKPMRLLDTRAGATDAAVTPGKPCTSSSATTVQLSRASYNGVTLPYAMMGVMGNVTVVNAAGAGYIELVPTGAGFTGAANLAYGSGQIISNFFNVGLSIVHASPGMMGGVSFDIIIGGASTDVIIDVFAIVS